MTEAGVEIYDPEGIVLKSPENIDYSDTLFIVTGGGSSPLGKEMTDEFKMHGGEVLVTTSNVDKMNPDNGIFPLDYNSDDLEHQISFLLNAVRKSDRENIVLVHNAAAGATEPITTLITGLKGLKRKYKNELVPNDEYTKLLDEVQLAVDGESDIARMVNFEGPRRLTEMILEDDEIGHKVSDVIFLSSLPSTFPEEFFLPFYPAVSQTKHEFEVYLRENAQSWRESGINTAIVSASIIVDTFVGGILTRILPRLLPVDTKVELDEKQLPTKADVLKAVNIAVCGEVPERNGLRSLFVLSSEDDGVVSALDRSNLGFQEAVKALKLANSIQVS